MSKLICTVLLSVYLFVLNLPAFSSEYMKAGSNSNSAIINSGTITDLKKDSVQENYAENVHMYICIEALKLLKLQYPQYDFSIFNTFIGTMDDVGSRPWQMARITTGAARDDMEDPVFDIRGPFGFYTSNSHFWDADDRTNGDHSLTTLDLGGNLQYPNAFTKIKKYIDGQWFSWNGNGYGGRRFVEYNPGNGFFYRYSYHLRGLIDFYKTNRIWQESYTNTLGETYLVRQEVTVTNLIKNRIVWEVLGRMSHLNQDMSVPAHTRGDVHVREWDGGDCYHNFVDDGGYRQFNAETAWNAGGFIDPYFNNDDPIRYLMYTSNQLADHYPSGPNCTDIPQQHFGDNNLPGGTYGMINEYYQSLGPSPIFINDVNLEAQYCFNHSIRSSAALLYWFAIETGIFPNTLPTVPHIVNFSKTLPDNYIYYGERLQVTCGATGSNLNYNWFFKVCDTTNECGVNIPGLQFSQAENKLFIYNNNFKDKWTCLKYDSLCNSGNSVNSAPQPLDFVLGVTVSNSLGSETKYFNFANNFWFKPSERLRPPPNPITGCPFIVIDTGYQFVYQNNVLKSSQNTKNLNKDVEDKFILKMNPFLYNDGLSMRMALKEISDDYNYIDHISISSVDFPKDRTLGITENNEIVTYSKNDIRSPLSAFLGETDVTKILHFNTGNSERVNGKLKDILNVEFDFPPADYSNKDNLKEKTAIIFDPGSPLVYPIVPVVKDVSGNVFVTDEEGNVNSKFLEFTIRQNSDEIILPSFTTKNIKSVNVDWLANFEMSYFAIVNLNYSGFIENKVILDSAEDMIKGNVLNLLNLQDENYTELDSTSHIILKFRILKNNIPEGMERKYVLTISGRSLKEDFPENNISGNEILSDNTLNPVKNKLFDNYPNPFNPNTIIRYSLSSENFTTVKIYNSLGKEVRSLVNENQKPGFQSVDFNGADLPSGIYYYKISSGNFVATKKMLLLK